MSEILVTKLLPPRTGDDLIERPRLYEVLNQAKTYRVILLTAPAGYGKTVLISQHLSRSGKPFVWYQLDSYDNDPLVFLNYLITGVRQYYPGFAQKTLHLENLTEQAANPRLAATVFINSLAVTIDDSLVIVFDDYHVIQEKKIHHFLQEFCLHIPSNIQIILAGRINPPLNFSRLNISGEILNISADSLRFNLEETYSFVTQKGINLSKESVSLLDEKTHGWPVALRLLNGSVVNILTESGIETNELYAYLASEVYGRQPEEIQKFLSSTSVLEVMTPEICDRLLERTDSERLLSILEKQQFFLIPLSGESKAYRYHQLFREFLLNRLGERRNELLRRAGRLAQKAGEIYQAVEYMLAAGIDHETLTLLKETGRQALHQGHWLTVARWLTKLPHEQITGEPWLCHFQAQVLIYRGQLDEAELWTIQAETDFRLRNEQPGIIESQILQARILRCRGRYEQSIILLEKAATNLSASEAQERFDLPMEKALSLILMGRLHKAEIILTKALDNAKSLNNRYLMAHLAEGLGNAFYIQGKYSQAMQSFQYGIRISPDRLLPGYYMQDSIAHIYKDWGHLDRALEFAKRNVSFKESMELSESLPSAYCQLGYVYAEIGETDLAHEYFRRGFEAAQQNNGDRYFKILNMSFLGWISSMQQHWVEARTFSEEAFQEAQDLGGLIIPISQMILGTILTQIHESNSARILLEESAMTLKKMGAQVPLCNAYKALSWLYDQCGETEQSKDYAYKYLQLAAKINYVRSFLPTTYHLLRPILKYGLLEGVEVAFVQRVIIQLGVKALELLEELALEKLAVESDERLRDRIIPLLMELGDEESTRILQSLCVKAGSGLNPRMVPEIYRNSRPLKLPTPPLRFQTFGPFRLFYRGTELTTIKWRTTKARDLLAYLAHHDKPISTDQILEDIWPNLNPDNAAAVFHSTLYYLRQALQRYAEKDLIIRGAKRYQLRPGSSRIDRRQFEEIARQTLKETMTESVVNELEEAAALYQGDYLSDLDYFWVIPTQEDLKNKYFEIKQRLACHYLKMSNYPRAVTHLRQLIAVKPFSEEALRLLLTALAGMGDIQGVKKEYLSFAKTISEELGLSPSQELTTLYQNISKK